ncbi:hypothetical protein HanIR_Chr03g0128481 [Helianthus annuus]|nr:hypothetical protein HanIR_Chr03g0128481 [Helianthus annuus]
MRLFRRRRCRFGCDENEWRRWFDPPIRFSTTTLNGVKVSDRNRRASGAALEVGRENHRPGPEISKVTFKKNLIYVIEGVWSQKAVQTFLQVACRTILLN